MNFYSQYGEDFILNELFQGKKRGFFVEVGCIDGKRFSNSLAFEEIGWRGICVEAHADYFGLLKKNRPRSVIVHCAVGSENCSEVPFYANARGSLSTLDRSKEKEYRERFGNFFTGFELQKVPQKTIGTILASYQINKIDFLSIDVEGTELDAVRGIDFSKCQPKVLVIEADEREKEEEIDRIVLKKGYSKANKIGPNIFYLLDNKMGIHLQEKYSFKLIHTKHPLDCGEDVVVEKSILWKKNG
jgi:FkbM family methyltransferase